MLTGVSSTTKQNLQLGAGIITTAYTPGGTIDASSIIGATRGGGSFTATPTMREVEADGIPQYVKDFEVIDDWVVTLNATMIEFKADNLKLAMPGATVTTVSGATTITASHTVASEDYRDIYWIGDLADGTKIAIKIANALNNSGLNLTISNKGEGTFALALIGHYDVASLSTAPFEIYR